MKFETWLKGVRKECPEYEPGLKYTVEQGMRLAWNASLKFSQQSATRSTHKPDTAQIKPDCLKCINSQGCACRLGGPSCIMRFKPA